MTKTTRITLALYLVALPAVIVSTVLIVVHVQNSPLPFDQAQWKRARTDWDWPPCSRMAKDLVNRKLLLGRRGSEIVQMLGDPERYTDTKPNESFYLTREDYPFMGIDPVRRDFLEITLDANEKAELS